MTTYATLEIEAQRIGWPEFYATDLTNHDRRRLESGLPAFVWVLRRCGTHLFEMGNPDDLSWISAAYGVFGPMPNTAGRPSRWYVYRDDQLTEAAPDRALRQFCASLKGLAVHDRKGLYRGKVARIDNPGRYHSLRIVTDDGRRWGLGDVEIEGSE